MVGSQRLTVIPNLALTNLSIQSAAAFGNSKRNEANRTFWYMTLVGIVNSCFRAWAHVFPRNTTPTRLLKL